MVALHWIEKCINLDVRTMFGVVHQCRRICRNESQTKHEERELNGNIRGKTTHT